MKRKSKKLTPKQQRFVDEYLIDLNASAAAIRSGYSKKTAGEIGFENLKKPEIVAAIQKAFVDRSERTEITADKVLREIAALATVDMGDLAKWDGRSVRLKASHRLAEMVRRAVVEVSQTKEGVRVKLASKTTALDMLCKHLGMYAPSRMEHTGKDGKPIKLGGGLTDETVQFLRRRVLGIDDEK